jgi:hypothetical protein
MTHTEFDTKVEKELNYWKNHFDKTPISRSFMTRTFTRTQDHNIQLELAKVLDGKGYKVEKSAPEYDGMVTWHINKL